MSSWDYGFDDCVASDSAAFDVPVGLVASNPSFDASDSSQSIASSSSSQGHANQLRLRASFDDTAVCRINGEGLFNSPSHVASMSPPEVSFQGLQDLDTPMSMDLFHLNRGYYATAARGYSASLPAPENFDLALPEPELAEDDFLLHQGPEVAAETWHGSSQSLSNREGWLDKSGSWTTGVGGLNYQFTNIYQVGCVQGEVLQIESNALDYSELPGNEHTDPSWTDGMCLKQLIEAFSSGFVNRSPSPSPESSDSKLPKGKQRYNDWDWEPLKLKFVNLYLERGLRLADVMSKLSKEDDFRPSLQMYKKRIKKWGIRKYMTSEQKAEIISRIRHEQCSDKPRTSLSNDGFEKLTRFIDDQARSGNQIIANTLGLKFRIYKELMNGSIAGFLRFCLMKSLSFQDKRPTLERSIPNANAGFQRLNEILQLDAAHQDALSKTQLKRSTLSLSTQDSETLSDKVHGTILSQICASFLSKAAKPSDEVIHCLSTIEEDLEDVSVFLGTSKAAQGLFVFAEFCDKYLAKLKTNPMVFLALLPCISDQVWKAHPEARACLYTLFRQALQISCVLPTGYAQMLTETKLGVQYQIRIWDGLSALYVARNRSWPALWFWIFINQLRCMYRNPLLEQAWQMKQKCLYHLRRGQRYLNDFKNRGEIGPHIEVEFAYESAIACKRLAEYFMAQVQCEKAIRLAHTHQLRRLEVKALLQLAEILREVNAGVSSIFQHYVRAFQVAFSELGLEHSHTLLAFARLKDSRAATGIDSQSELGTIEADIKAVENCYI